MDKVSRIPSRAVSEVANHRRSRMSIRNTLTTLTHKGTAYVQAILSFLFIGAYFYILIKFMDGGVKVPVEFKDAFTALLGVLTANVVQMMSFWFSRQRTSADPTAPGTP